jgi:hypothetical protein
VRSLDFLSARATRERGGGNVAALSRGAGAMAQASGSEEVRFTTTMGDFSVELYPQFAPKTCQNFAEL